MKRVIDSLLTKSSSIIGFRRADSPDGESVQIVVEIRELARVSEIFNRDSEGSIDIVVNRKLTHEFAANCELNDLTRLGFI